MVRSPQPPDPCLRFDPLQLNLREYPRSFFLHSTEYVARRLVGAWLGRHFQNAWYGARIVETEAYLGCRDAAAHSWRGRRTPRVAPMYRIGGHLYVFLVYGMHHCANVVTRAEGVPEAVLLRAGEGPPGTPIKLLSGPGKLCAALGITVAASGIDLLADSELHLFQGRGKKPQLGVSPRIGVEYAGEARHWPLRFYDRVSAAVSKIRISY
jgi:DNA-3-methyladenine glycosylase